MPLPSTNQAVQYVDQKDEKGNVIEHPVLDPGDFHVTGTIDAHGAGELATERAELIGSVVSLTRTSGGGIVYEFAIKVDYSKADAADAAAAAKAKADAGAAAAKAKVDAEAAAVKAQSDKDAADARLASAVAAAVAKAVAPKANA